MSVGLIWKLTDALRCMNRHLSEGALPPGRARGTGRANGLQNRRERGTDGCGAGGGGATFVVRGAALSSTPLESMLVVAGGGGGAGGYRDFGGGPARMIAGDARGGYQALAYVRGCCAASSIERCTGPYPW